jgi:hypothetical protein
VDPISEKLGDILALPLRSHMTSSVNCSEIKAIIADKIARYLAISEPGIPVGLNFPVEHLNPSAGAEGRDSTIGIS